MPATYRPIQKKLLRVLMLTCGLVLLLAFIALFVFEYVSYRNIARRELKELAQILAANTASSLSFDVPEDAEQVLHSLRIQKNVEAVRLYRANDTVFAGYGKATDLPRTDPGISSVAFRGRFLECYEPVMQDDRRVGTLYLRSNLDVMYRRLVLYGVFALLTFALAAMLAYLFSRRMQRSISNPILHLAATAGMVSREKNYSVRATHQSNDEVGQLTTAFNSMLAQIEAQNAEISGLNQNLEAKVQERTQQLRESNRTLQEQKDFINKIIDASIDLVAVFDRDLRYLVINEMALRIYGRQRTDMLHRKVTDVYPALRGSRVEQLLYRSLAGEFIHDDSYQSQVSDRVLQNFYIPLANEQGAIDRVLLIGHDITDLMHTQRQLQAINADLEKSNRDLEQFAYVASHDLQEPLRKIQTFADLSQRNIQHPQILERYLGKIASSAERMSNLIRDVLQFSRLSRSGTEAFAPIDLNTVLAGIRADLELLVEEKGALIQADPLPTIRGNALQLGQLFQNLLSNALKFSERKPEVRIAVTYVDGPLQTHGVSLRAQRYAGISFQDNGIGFDPQYGDKIFAIFQRLHSSSEYAGTGIGLAICKKIVENHGGGIGVESTPGVGTTFYVFLPLVAEAPQDASILVQEQAG